MKIKIAKILPFTSVDGVGNRTIIFFQGCNFNCKYCHNPETIPMDFIEDKTIGKEMTIDEILSFVGKYKDFTRGITISGGECTHNFGQLFDLVKELKKLEYNVLIDTNAYIDIEDLEKLESYCDGFMLDIKSFDRDEHTMLTGKDNEKVLNAFKFLAEKGKIYEVRTVIAENLLDNRRNVFEISKLIARYDKNIRYKIIRYRSHGVRKGNEKIQTPSNILIEELRETAENNGLRNILLI